MKKNDVVQLVEGIHTEKELNEFMVREQAIRGPFDNVQYTFYCIPDYQEGKSALVIKLHHCFADGLAVGSFLLSLCGEYDSSALPGMKPLGLCKQLMIYLLYPFLILRSCVVMFSSPADFNCMKRGVPMTGRKHGAFTEDLDLVQIKQFCKQNSCTIHEYTTCVLSNTFYEYMENHRTIDGKKY